MRKSIKIGKKTGKIGKNDEKRERILKEKKEKI